MSKIKNIETLTLTLTSSPAPSFLFSTFSFSIFLLSTFLLFDQIQVNRFYVLKMLKNSHFRYGKKAIYFPIKLTFFIISNN